MTISKNLNESRRRNLAAFLCLLVLLFGQAEAQTEELDPRLKVPASSQEYPSADAVLLMDDIRFDVLPDRTHIFEEHDAVKVLSQDGVDENATLTRVVDSSLARIEVLSARTIKADGRILKAEPAETKTLAQDSQVYSSVQRFDLAFPDVEVGDIVEFHLRTVRKPLRGGHFWATTYVENPMPIADSSFTVTIPDNVPFRYAAPGVENQEPKKETVTRDGVKCQRLTWRIQNQRAYSFEALAPSAITLLNRIEISSFQDWEEVADFLGHGWKEHSVITEGLALRVAGWMPDSGSVQERARAVLRELARERKVTGLLSEFPDFHAPPKVFDEQLCSVADAALLISTALSSAGINHIPVATMGVSVESLADELPNPEKVEKIVLQLPLAGGTSYWVDPENGGFLLESPPPGTGDTAAISWDPRWNRGLAELDIASPLINREELAVEGRLDPSGRAEITVQFDRYGAVALDARQAARDINEGARGTRDRTLDTYFRNTARTYGQRARVLAQFFELDPERDDPFSLSYTLAVPNFGKSEGNTLLVPLPQFLSSNLRLAARRRNRSTPLRFDQPYQQDVRIHLLFPEGSRVDSAPATIERRTPEAEFVATGRAEGNEVWYVGRLTVRDPWVDQAGLDRTLEVLSTAIESENTIVKVDLAPGTLPEASGEVTEEEEEEDEDGASG